MSYTLDDYELYDFDQTEDDTKSIEALENIITHSMQILTILHERYDDKDIVRVMENLNTIRQIKDCIKYGGC